MGILQYNFNFLSGFAPLIGADFRGMVQSGKNKTGTDVQENNPMRFNVNPDLNIEPIHDHILITFKDSRMVDEQHIARIEDSILEVADLAHQKQIILNLIKLIFMKYCTVL